MPGSALVAAFISAREQQANHLSEEPVLLEEVGDQAIKQCNRHLSSKTPMTAGVWGDILGYDLGLTIFDESLLAPVQRLAEFEPAYLRDLGWVLGGACCLWRGVGLPGQQEGQHFVGKARRGIDARKGLPTLGRIAGFFAEFARGGQFWPIVFVFLIAGEALLSPGEFWRRNPLAGGEVQATCPGCPRGRLDTDGSGKR